MRGSIALVVILILAVAVAALGYIAFSAAISLDHARTEQVHQQQRERVLQVLLLKAAGHMSRDQLITLIKENFSKDHLVKEEKNQIAIDDIVLKFEGNKVSSLSSLNDESESRP